MPNRAEYGPTLNRLPLDPGEFEQLFGRSVIPEGLVRQYEQEKWDDLEQEFQTMIHKLDTEF